MIDAKKIYRLFLMLYPARFREEYATPLEQQFWDEYRQLGGAGERAWFWIRALVDLSTSIPRQILRELRQDADYALRTYKRRAVASALAFIALALGIGALTGIFSVLNGVLFRSLPFRDAGRLVEIQHPPVNPLLGRSKFYRWRHASTYCEDIAAYSVIETNPDASHTATRVKVAEVSANFLKVLGTEPLLGRDFMASEDVPGHDGVAVISYGFWQQFFGADPNVLGRTIHANGAFLL